MSHGRPTRRVRFRPATNMLRVVINRAAKLTPAELDQVLAPVQEALQALREGVADELQWLVLASSVEVALAIESHGIVRGLRGHMNSAELALAEVRRRAMASGAWCATALYYQELDDIVEAVRLHRYQLEQLSAGEVTRAVTAATTRVRQVGGTAVELEQLRLAA